MGLGVFLVVMVLIPIAVHFLERIGQERAACLASWSGYLWMGALFFAFCLFLIVDVWNWSTRIGTAVTGFDRSAWMIGARSAALLALGGAVLLSVYSAWEATRLRTERIVFPSAKVSQPTRIVPDLGRPRRIHHRYGLHRPHRRGRRGGAAGPRGVHG